MTTRVAFIDADTIKDLLTWEKTFEAVEAALKSTAIRRAVQQPRTFTTTLDTDATLLTMPGYLSDDKYGALTCKLVTICPNNVHLPTPRPTINANIVLLDDVTGDLKAIIDGTEITKWRTAAASAIATRCLRDKLEFNSLAVLGAGAQGRIHAIAFQHMFDIKEIRIWNHNHQKAKDLSSKLNQLYGGTKFKAYESNKKCVKGADVIVTATFSKEPIVEYEWLREGVHINAVGAGTSHHSELSELIYQNTNVYVDHLEGADAELIGLKNIGVQFKGQIGSLLVGQLTPPPANETTVFQSLGMAVEDSAMARMIYDLYIQTKV